MNENPSAYPIPLVSNAKARNRESVARLPYRREISTRPAAALKRILFLWGRKAAPLTNPGPAKANGPSAGQGIVSPKHSKAQRAAAQVRFHLQLLGVGPSGLCDMVWPLLASVCPSGPILAKSRVINVRTPRASYRVGFSCLRIQRGETSNQLMCRSRPSPSILLSRANLPEPRRDRHLVAA